MTTRREMKEALAAFQALPGVGKMRARDLLLYAAGVQTAGLVPPSKYRAVREAAITALEFEIPKNWPLVLKALAAWRKQNGKR